MSIIKIENISKSFDEKLVLDNISFEIDKGDIFGLIGPNGAGKSTLINIITGILDPSSGSVSIGGFDIKKSPIKAKTLIGLVPQELALIESVTAYDNLEFFGSLYGLKGKTLKNRIKEAMELTGLSKNKKERVQKFSGGMKRRLNLAAAIMHQPEILILDEPTVGIDPQSRNHIFQYIKDINRERNTTVLYTSHYMEEVEFLCKEIFILDKGKEIAYGSKSSVKEMISTNNKIHIETYNMEEGLLSNIENLKGIIDAQISLNMIDLLVEEKEFNLKSLLDTMEKGDVNIKNINIQEPNLEEVFLALTGKNLRD